MFGDGLELLMNTETSWYWRLEYWYYEDGKYTGETVLLHSISYNSDRDAINALRGNSIKWD